MAAPQVVASAKSGTLAQTIKNTDTPSTLLVNVTENWDVTSGVVRVSVGDSREWFAFTGLTVVTANVQIRLTGITRALKKAAASLVDNDIATYAKSHAIGAKVVYVHHSAQINKFVQKDADNTISGNNTITGTTTFSSTTKATLALQNTTEAQRDALSGAANGAVEYNSDNGTIDVFVGGAWAHLSTGSTVNASETVGGVAELATVAEQGSAAATGATGAALVVQTKYLKKTSAGAGDENKIAILDSTGKFDSSFMPDSSTKFGGDGTDGAVSGATTITGSNSTYIVKNYTDFTPGANTIDITPTNCILHIKVNGDADLTGSTIDLAGKGGPGGAGGSAQGTLTTAGNVGTEGTDGIAYLGAHTPDAGNGGGTSLNVTSTPSDGGSAGTIPDPIGSLAYMLGSRSIMVAPGAGGGGGGSGGTGANAGSVSGAGGSGGGGGGCLILEVAGDLTLSGTTINVAGTVGEDGSAGTGTSYGGSGGGGGGGGGTCVILYGGTLTGSVTPTVSAGAGGAEGSGNESRGGAGGGGGASIIGDGTAGTTVSAGNDGGAGGAGATGAYLIAANRVFQ